MIPIFPSCVGEHNKLNMVKDTSIIVAAQLCLQSRNKVKLKNALASYISSVDMLVTGM